jgi:hypothetical protein
MNVNQDSSSLVQELDGKKVETTTQKHNALLLAKV